MAPQLVSLKPKPTIPPNGKAPTNVESNPAYSDKTAFPTIAREDDWPVKRRSAPGSGADERKRDTAPIHIHREPDFARRTKRGYSAKHSTGRTRPPRVSRQFESKFHALERRQKNLVQQTKLQGQIEYLAVSQSSTGQYWITVEGTGKPFIRIPFETPEYCFECALDLEDTFEILQVIELRPPETIERIEEMVGVYLDRERVARIWG